MVGISTDEDRKKLDRFLRKQTPSYPVVHDIGEDSAWWAFRVPTVPATFLLDVDGQIVAQWGGDFSEEALLRAPASLQDAD